jgi:hypothetical protein
MNPIYARAQRLLNLADFSRYIPPLDCGTPHATSCPHDRQYILRMLVSRPEDDSLSIPQPLGWLADDIRSCWEMQASNGLNPSGDFVYVTVRHGEITSLTDDLWHVDGFSTRVPHRPEQNYFFSDAHPTEVLSHGFDIPADFDPLRHNIHEYFQDHADERPIATLDPGRVHLLDPYIVHRRPPGATGHRTFFRISFVPIEIEDDTCMRNPLFPPKVYGREDCRKRLGRYVARQAKVMA